MNERKNGYQALKLVYFRMLLKAEMRNKGPRWSWGQLPTFQQEAQINYQHLPHLHVINEEWIFILFFIN